MLKYRKMNKSLLCILLMLTIPLQLLLAQVVDVQPKIRFEQGQQVYDLTHLGLNSPFQVSMKVDFNLTDCPNATSFKAEVTFPNMIITAKASIGGLAVGYASLAHDPNNFNKLIITFTPPQNELPISAPAFAIQNLFTQSEGCQNESGQVSANLYMCDPLTAVSSSTIDIKVLNINNLTITEQRAYSNFSSYCVTESPLKRLITVSKSNSQLLLPAFSVEYDYDSHLKCVAITQVDGNSPYFNLKNIPAADIIDDIQNHKITFRSNALSSQITSSSYFVLYFDIIQPITTSTIPFSAKATANYPFCQNVLLESNLYTGTIPIDPACDYISKPDILVGSLTATCANYSCANTVSFDIQVDNSFNSAQQSYENLFAFDLSFGHNVNIESFKLKNDLYLQSFNGTVTLYYQVNGIDTDILYNGTFTADVPIAKSTLGVSSSNRISKVKFIFSRFSDYMSARFNFAYSLSNPTVPYSTSDFNNVTSTVIADYNAVPKVTSKTRVFTLPSLTGVDCSGVYLYDYLSINNGAKFSDGWTQAELSPTDQSTRTSIVQLQYIGEKNNYAFEYDVNTTMFKINNISNLKFYYGSAFDINSGLNGSSGYIALFKDKAAFLFEHPEFAGFTCSLDVNTGKLIVTGLPLQDNGCTNANSINNMKFHVGFDLKVNQYAAATQYLSNLNWSTSKATNPNFEYIYTNLFWHSRGIDVGYGMIWQIAPTANYKPYIFTSCDETYGKQNLDLKPSDEFTYHYQIKNLGSTSLTSISAIGVLPHANDVTVLQNDSRGTTGTTLPCPNISQIQFAVNDVYGNSAMLINPVTANDFLIQFSPVDPGTNICLSTPAELDQEIADQPANCTHSSWDTQCPASAVVAIKITKKAGSTFQLKAFNTLDIAIKSQIPSSAVIGQKYINDFAARVKNSQNVTLNLSASEVTTITVAPKSTCEICLDCDSICKECVPSFSPLPGQEYLLSAWVKESYTDKYPDTYIHSGVKITFNNGTVILPLMRPAGPVIEGWQRIEASFMVPANAKNIQIELVNDGAAGDVFFDDIRIHPFRSNMKSFVYNPSTQKLTAELDENNYSTQYEYDDEGILIRVKKETERGVMTIKETRNNQSKVQGTH